MHFSWYMSLFLSLSLSPLPLFLSPSSLSLSLSLSLSQLWMQRHQNVILSPNNTRLRQSLGLFKMRYGKKNLIYFTDFFPFWVCVAYFIPNLLTLTRIQNCSWIKNNHVVLFQSYDMYFSSVIRSLWFKLLKLYFSSLGCFCVEVLAYLW